MYTLHSITTQTPDGPFHIIIDGNELAQASGYGVLADLIQRLPESLQGSTVVAAPDHPYSLVVTAYYDGDASAFDTIPRSQTGTDFQKKVWQAMSTIPYGQTVSYKALAASSGNPAAIRAAGTICGLNRLILLVPCHRVLKSDGSVGSYLYGPAIKASLLRREKSYVEA